MSGCWTGCFSFMSAKPSSPAASNPTSAAPAAVEFKVKVAPPDPILVTAQLFNQDTDPKKVNLGIGAYRTEKGVPWVLPSIKAAEMIIAQDPKAIKEYLAIDGLPELKKDAQELVFAPATLSSGRVASCQALSGTGALRVAGEFLNCQLGVKKLYHSDPTWGNHTAIFNKCNMKVGTYPYYHEATRGFDFDGMMAGIKKMEPGSVILLHACAHNPTGVDPTNQQWPRQGQLRDEALRAERDGVRAHAVLREELRPLRRAHRCLALRLRGQGTRRRCALASEARRAADVLLAAEAGGGARREGPQRPEAQGAVDVRAQGDVRSHCEDAQGAPRQARGARNARNLEPHHGSDRYVLVHGAVRPAVRAPPERVPHLLAQVRPHLHGRIERG